MTLRAGGLGALSMTLVGGSVGVSAVIAHYPLYAAQAVRYAIGALMLQLWVVLRGYVLPRPHLRELLRLLALAAIGQVAFNSFLVVGLRHAEPAAIGVVVGIVPLVLAVLAPLMAHQRPRAWLVVAGAIVVGGVALVEGGGHTSWLGLSFAVATLCCEVALTLIAVPLLPRLGALTVSLYSSALASALSIPLIPLLDQRLVMPSRAEATAVIFLALSVTALAPITWYMCVEVIGSDRAGLLAGLMPVAALAAGVLSGTQELGLRAIAGTMLVALGVVFGLSSSTLKRTASSSGGSEKTKTPDRPPPKPEQAPA